MSLRLLLVSGSIQKRSSNRAVLDVVRSSCKSEVTVSDGIDLASVPAFTTESDSSIVSEVAQWRSEVSAADAVLISSPEYAAAMPGSLKNALDWLVGNGELYGKPVALVSAGTSGGSYARAGLIRSLTWQGAHVVAQLGIPAPREKSDTDGKFTDPVTISAINNVLDVLLSSVSLSLEERVGLVERVTTAAGVEPGHVANSLGL